MTNSHPFDEFDSAPLVCFLDGSPEAVYGPFEPLDAMRFVEAYNKFFAERNLPGIWVARPIVPPTDNSIFSL